MTGQQTGAVLTLQCYALTQLFYYKMIFFLYFPPTEKENK